MAILTQEQGGIGTSWVPLGYGPMEVCAASLGTVLTCTTDDVTTQPPDALVGFPASYPASRKVQSASYVWARALAGSIAIIYEPFSIGSGGSSGGSGGTTVTSGVLQLNLDLSQSAFGFWL